MSLFFPKKSEFPEVSVSSPGKKATLTPTQFTLGDPTGTHVFIKDGAYFTEKIVNGIKTVGGFFSNGVTYYSGATEWLPPILTMSLNETGALLLADVNGIFFGGLENVYLFDSSTYTIPTEGINLNFTVIIPGDKEVSITMGSGRKGQIVRVYNYGPSTNDINGSTLDTMTCTTCEFITQSWTCTSSPIKHINRVFDAGEPVGGSGVYGLALYRSLS